jgi:hypothetical protein
MFTHIKQQIKPSNFIQAVMLLTCIWEVPHSNLGRDTEYPDGFKVFLGPFSEMTV